MSHRLSMVAKMDSKKQLGVALSTQLMINMGMSLVQQYLVHKYRKGGKALLAKLQVIGMVLHQKDVCRGAQK